jgi:SAM-dependent methyltransferase
MKNHDVTSGSLHRFAEPTARHDLNGLSLIDLSAELLARLNSGREYDGSEELLLAERLGQVLATKLDVHLNRFSARRHHDLLSPILRRLKPADLKGATVVDLGCGSVNPFAFSFLLLMLGAARAHAIDLEPIQNLEIATKALATAAGWFLLDSSRILGADCISPEDVLGNLNGFQLPLLATGDPAGIAPGRLLHRIESVHDLSLGDGEAGVVFSVSLLEHLDRVDEALESLRRITAPGGLGIHVIDFVDHRIYSGEVDRPFEFLKVDSTKPLVHGSNRILCDQFSTLFEQHGFACEQVERWERRVAGLGQIPNLSEEERSQFVEPYRSMPQENLTTTGARFFVRRS